MPPMKQHPLVTGAPFRDRDYTTGRVRLPPDVAAMPDSRFFIYGGDTESAGATIAAGATATISLQIDDSAYFLVEAISAKSSLLSVAADQILCQLTDTTTARPWSDNPVPLRDFAGLGFSPKYLNDPQLVRPTATLNIQVTNNTGSAVTIYFALIGRKLPSLTEAQAILMLKRSWFQYVIKFAGGIGASAVAVHAQTKVQNDSDFFVKKLLSQQVLNALQALAGGPLSQELMVLLRDTNGDRNYANQKIPASLLFGALAGQPLANFATTPAVSPWSMGDAMSLPKPILIRRNSIVDIEMDNRSASAVTSDLNIVLEGIRVFGAENKPAVPA